MDMLRVHWFDVLQTIFMIAGFWFTARSFHMDNRSRFLRHLMDINEQNQDIKRTAFENGELERVFRDCDNCIVTVTAQERFYVRRIMNHIYIVYMTMKLSNLGSFSGIDKDIKNFFSHAIPKKVWTEEKQYQEQEFVDFVDELLDK